jgi:hypothetical protein
MNVCAGGFPVVWSSGGGTLDGVQWKKSPERVPLWFPRIGPQEGLSSRGSHRWFTWRGLLNGVPCSESPGGDTRGGGHLEWVSWRGTLHGVPWSVSPGWGPVELVTWRDPVVGVCSGVPWGSHGGFLSRSPLDGISWRMSHGEGHLKKLVK